MPDTHAEGVPNGSTIAEEKMQRSDVNMSNIPVIYGASTMNVGGLPMRCRLQYRRLQSRAWIIDRSERSEGNVEGIIRPGDEWTYGP